MIVICSSSDPSQLRALLATLDSTTFRGVISFGVAGGLDPALKSGDVVVATEVLAGDTRWLAGSALNEEMIASVALRRRRVVRGGLAGVEKIVVARDGKAALRSETGAAAVDMESHIAAAYAAEAGVPFAALRVISDPAGRALLALAMSAIKPNGDIDLRKVLRGIARTDDAARAGLDRNRFQPRAAQPARLSRFSAGQREPDRGGNLNRYPPRIKCGAGFARKRHKNENGARSVSRPVLLVVRGRSRRLKPSAAAWRQRRRPRPCGYPTGASASAEKMYCAGRWLSRLISGAIAPGRTAQRHPHCLQRISRRALAAVGSRPQCAMQSAHFSYLPVP